jgi:H+-translocating NAD(P) transhydrogenase subunit alpha
MRVFVPREQAPAETRTPLIPATAEKLVKLGAQVEVEPGLGASIGVADADYVKAGAAVAADRAAALAGADLVIRLRPPPPEDVQALRRGAIHLSLLDPFQNRDLVKTFAAAGVSAISLEMIPRSTIAQKMDVLSSQANLAGYVAVLLAAERLPKILPMMSTPAGTLAPARVFIVGAGVAGLQAIATARRLGAIVEAFDTRPAVEEQVKSLGARFLKIDLGETGQTRDGYAKALTEDQIHRQREAMTRAIAGSDIVITTAQVFGRTAPRIVTADMVRAMRPGSVVIDLAADTGGNVEGSKPGEEVEIQGVRVIGASNLPARVPAHASQMFSSNLGNFIEHFWDAESKSLRLDRADEIIKGCLLTHGGEIVHESFKT